MSRHRFDPSSLIAAVIFLGLAVRYLVAGPGRGPVTSVWVLPGVLVAVGLIGVLRLAFRSRRRDP